jgi:hypothetical protein
MAKKDDPKGTPTTPTFTSTIAATGEGSKSYQKFGPMTVLENAGDNAWPILVGRGGVVYLHKTLPVANAKKVTITVTVVE